MENFDLKKYLAEGRLLKENLSNRAEELEMDFMDPRNKFGDEWQEEVSNVLVRKYDGHWENWENENPKELEMLLNKFKNLAEGRLLKEDFSITGESKSEKWDSLSDEDRETALLSAIEDPDNAQEYIDFKYEDLPSEVTSNMIFEDEDGGDIIGVVKSILKDQPMDINNYLNSLKNDIRLNGSEGYIEFGDDDWVEDYEEYMADRARA